MYFIVAIKCFFFQFNHSTGFQPSFVQQNRWEVLYLSQGTPPNPCTVQRTP